MKVYVMVSYDADTDQKNYPRKRRQFLELLGNSGWKDANGVSSTLLLELESKSVAAAKMQASVLFNHAASESGLDGLKAVIMASATEHAYI